MESCRCRDIFVLILERIGLMQALRVVVMHWGHWRQLHHAGGSSEELLPLLRFMKRERPPRTPRLRLRPFHYNNEE